MPESHPIPRCFTYGLLCAAILFGPVAQADETCTPPAHAGKRLLWGDLHVHTAYSLDAYAFGALATPEDAYAFARGDAMILASGEAARIDRPLDFAAVTDHAETFDAMWACTDPMHSDDPWCRTLRELRSSGEGRKIFTDYVLPIFAPVPPIPPKVCHSEDCEAARTGQWQRMQAAANAANEPCAFTALIGYEWSGSPGGMHWHRNVIYRSDVVPGRAFDYLRYPQVGALWQALASACRPENGCDVLTIPHNINWAYGGTFDLTGEPPAITGLRRRFERLAEIHQEKGNSECLPEAPDSTSEDCGFELLTENAARARYRDTADGWEAMRASYYRTLLGAGLARKDNPFMLGAIGSTDTHFGTPGMVAEASYFGGIAVALAPQADRLKRTQYNGGGLVAVWAEENTRADVFDALRRREAYATSGPRIRLRFGADPRLSANPHASADPRSSTGAEGVAGGGSSNFCADPEGTLHTPMGGLLTRPQAPTFAILAEKDRTPLQRIEIIRGSHGSGGPAEEVIQIAEFASGRDAVCLTWTDPEFDPDAPAYWYVRVLEVPSPRWSKLFCEKLDKCAEYPEADVMIRERAWSSPIWYRPAGG